MSPWLFYTFVNRIFKDINEKTIRREASQRNKEGIRQFLHVNDTVLIVKLKYKLRVLADKYIRACDRVGLKINFKKSTTIGFY